MALLKPAIAGAVEKALSAMAGVISRHLDTVVRDGSDPVVAAKQITKWITPPPAYRWTTPAKPRVEALGRVQGSAAAAIKTELRTQSTTLFSRGQQMLARQRREYVKWELSPSHKHADICDEHAHSDYGFGAGVFLADSAPSPPTHRNCRCRLRRVSASEVAAEIGVAEETAEDYADLWYSVPNVGVTQAVTRADIAVMQQARQDAGIDF